MTTTKAAKAAPRDGLEQRVTGLVQELRLVSDQLLAEIAERTAAAAALERSQETIEALLNATPDAALLVGTDGTILAANSKALMRLRRYAGPDHQEDLAGVSVYELFQGDLAHTRRARNEAVMRSGKAARYEDHRNGRWYDNSTYPVQAPDGEIVGLAIFSRDITEWKTAEAAIRQSQETIRALLNAPTDASLLVDPAGNIMAANETAARRLASHAGIAFDGNAEALHGLNVYDLLPEELASARRERNEQVIKSGEPARYEDERNGSWFDNSIYPVFSVEGKVVSLAVFSRDITELKLAQEKYRQMALHDSLTGLPNRAALQARLDTALSEARKNGGNLTVMCLDLDGFKQLNDTMGHEAGDRMLSAIGERLRGVIRGRDTAARLGGDEFVLVFPGANRETATLVAERVIAAIRDPYDIGGTIVQMSTSIGIAVYPDDGLYSEALLRSADGAMYRAKYAGRDRFELVAHKGAKPAAKKRSKAGPRKAPAKVVAPAA